jgi:hypothetical protein
MTDSEFDKFDAVMRRMIAVPHVETKKREKEWKQRKGRKKATSSLPSRASSDKG